MSVRHLSEHPWAGICLEPGCSFGHDVLTANERERIAALWLGPSGGGATAYVPTPEELDDLCAAISACAYASEAVETVENWTRERWGVESAFTTAMAGEPR